MNFQINELIHKYYSETISEEELTVLTNLLKQPENQKIFKAYTKYDFHLNLELNNINTKDEFEKINHLINTQEQKVFRLPNSWLKYAAIFILLLGIGGLLYKFNFTEKDYAPNFNNNQITLKLQDGTIQVLDTDKTDQIYNHNRTVVISKVRNKIAYTNNTKITTLEYNTLTVPYGRIFELELSDGTNVVLNAGTSIRYPVQFIKGSERKVYLSGEAYFDVAHDKEHPFIVNNNMLNIKVLGTEFNVSAYDTDRQSEVVLVNGKVSLYNNSNSNQVVILPNTKATFNKKATSITTQNVDTGLYTAWMHGELVFRNALFSEIRKKLEHRYNITIINNNEELENEVFNARFKNKSLNEVLEYLSEIYSITYTKSAGKITIH